MILQRTSRARPDAPTVFPVDEWQRTWDEYLAEAQKRHPEYAPDDYYRSGRASKAYPDKEGPEWWAENGPKFVSSWTSWREASGLRIADFPGAEGEAVPGIELEVLAETMGYGEKYMAVKSVIDRVMIDPKTDDLYIVDLKTGSMTAPWPLQMALNNLGVVDTYGPEYRARWAGYWSARKGGVVNWFDLSIYSDEWMWDLVAKAYEIRDQGLFIPNPGNLCNSACGVKQFCVAMGGSTQKIF